MMVFGNLATPNYQEGHFSVFREKTVFLFSLSNKSGGKYYLSIARVLSIIIICRIASLFKLASATLKVKNSIRFMELF